MQAARRRADFDFPRRLGRRAEAGPRRVLPRVRPPIVCVFVLTEAKMHPSDLLATDVQPEKPGLSVLGSRPARESR